MDQTDRKNQSQPAQGAPQGAAPAPRNPRCSTGFRRT